MNERKNRVTFHSKSDLSAGYHLRHAETIIKNFGPTLRPSINDVIEFYQIKLYFDNDLSLTTWTDDMKKSYSNTVNEFWKAITYFWSKITDNDILGFYNKVEYQYQDAFWHLIDLFKTYKIINSSTFISILESDSFHISQVLKQENIVKYFSTEIRNFFIRTIKSAEVLLSAFEEEHSSRQAVLYFPLILSHSDKELIIQNYLDFSDPNINYVRLIVDSKFIKLPDKLKLKARRLADTLNKEILEKGVSWTQGVQVSISKVQIEPVKTSYDPKDNTLAYSYSESWLNLTQDSVEVLQNFANLFEYINNQGCINLVSKTSEIDSFERTFMRSKNEYFVYSKLREKMLLSQGQFVLYSHYLEGYNIKIENVLSDIINGYINENYHIKGLKITFPSVNTLSFEKIRSVAPELDFLIKQYKSYSEEGFIDFELIQFSSSPLNLSQVKSKVDKKYAYGQGDEFSKLKYCFFSRQSMLHYLEPYIDKYQNLYQLLNGENVKYEEFKNYQKDELDYLISAGYLIIDKEKVVRINNPILIYIIGVFYFEEVLNYWHYPENIRVELLKLEREGLVRFENTLFTIEERRYLNFFLNKKEFTNGFDLRNKYLHGTNTDSNKKQQNDYFKLLQILILITLKIIDDLNVEKEAFKHE